MYTDRKSQYVSVLHSAKALLQSQFDVEINLFAAICDFMLNLQFIFIRDVAF